RQHGRVESRDARRRAAHEHRRRFADQGPADEVLPEDRGASAGAAARQHRAAQGRVAVLPAAPGRVLRQGHAAQGDAERRRRPQDAEPLSSVQASSGPRRPHGPQWLWGLLYAAPAVVLVSMFVAYPFGSILYHAFTRWDGIAR